jgi:hypothetical protein
MRSVYEIKNVMFDFSCDWSNLWSKYNWYTFRLINIEMEWDRYCGSLEFMTAFLGFGLRIAIAIPTKKSIENLKRWDDLVITANMNSALANTGKYTRWDDKSVTHVKSTKKAKKGQ